MFSQSLIFWILYSYTVQSEKLIWFNLYENNIDQRHSQQVPDCNGYLIILGVDIIKLWCLYNAVVRNGSFSYISQMINDLNWTSFYDGKTKCTEPVISMSPIVKKPPCHRLSPNSYFCAINQVNQGT